MQELEAHEPHLQHLLLTMARKAIHDEGDDPLDPDSDEVRNSPRSYEKFAEIV